MAQELIIYLRHKENPKLKVTLLCLTTTPARAIPRITGAFKYTEEELVLDSTQLNVFISSMENERAEIIKFMEKEKLSKADLIHILTKCETAVAIKEIKESIQESDDTLAEWQEDLDNWTYWIDCVKFCANAAQDSDNSEWDLYYINC